MYTDAPNNWSDKTENISGTVDVDTSFVTGAGEILVLGAEAECLPILAPVRPARTSRRYIDFDVTVPVLMGFDLGRYAQPAFDFVQCGDEYSSPGLNSNRDSMKGAATMGRRVADLEQRLFSSGLAVSKKLKNRQAAYGGKNLFAGRALQTSNSTVQVIIRRVNTSIIFASRR